MNRKLLRDLILLSLVTVAAAVSAYTVARWRHRSSASIEPVRKTSAEAQYSPRLVHVIEQLRESSGEVLRVVDKDGKTEPPLPFIGGCSVGYAGRPGVFFLLIPYFEQMAQTNDLALMLKDQSAVVRVMAARLIFRGTNIWTHQFPLSVLDDDKEMVQVARGGCIINTMTVGELVKQIRENSDYFGEHWYYESLAADGKKEEEANQALVPTATSVTPAADAPVAPAAAAAHL